MNILITLICNPASIVLNNGILGHIIDTLSDAGGLPGAVDWLDGPVACDLPCGGLTVAEADRVVRDVLGELPVDVIIHDAAEQRRRKLLIADMDSTIITVECLDELADFAGKKAQVSAITERAMRGELDFAAALHERIAMLSGLPESTLAEAYDARVQLTPGARTLVQTMRANGARTMLVSGGFTYFTQRVAVATGFQETRANRLLFEDEQLTGVAEPILGREAKLHSLHDQCTEHGLVPTQSLAVGDGANDLDMIAASGMGVAYHAKPVVAQQARARIDHGDLSALLYLQGYRGEELVRD